MRAQTPTLSHVGLYSSVTATVTVDAGEPLRLEGTRLSPAVLDMLGARPALGRVFLPSEEMPSAGPAAPAKAWRVPARYAGYKADPVLVLGSLETIYRQLP